LSVKYRGTNTTGVKVSLFLEGETAGKRESLDIFPSDVRFVTHEITETELEAGTVRVGIKMETPPVFGRITDFVLTEV